MKKLCIQPILLCVFLAVGAWQLAAAQAVGGLATDVRSGTALPVDAKPSSIFVIDNTTPWQVWLCQTTPACTTAGHWTQIGVFNLPADVMTYDSFGNSSITGKFTALQLATSGTGPWSVTGNYGSQSVSAVGKFLLGAGLTCLEYSYNASTLACVSMLDAYGNVIANANTATKLAALPSSGAGAYCTGIDQFGNCIPGTSNYIQLATMTCSTIAGLSLHAMLCPDSTNGWEVNVNAGGWAQYAHSNLFNLNGDTLEEYDGAAATPQAFNIYRVRTDAGDYERMRLGYDANAGAFIVGAEYLGSGSGRNFCLYWGQYGVSSGCKWWMPASSTPSFYPNTNYSAGVGQDIGASANQLRDIYIGRNIIWQGTTYTPSSFGGSMSWPATPGIAVCTGTPCTAWTTSATAPGSPIVGTTDTQTLTGKTLDGVTPATMGYVDPTSSIQTQLNAEETASAAQAAFAGHGGCTNQVQTADNANAAPTCASVTDTLASLSIKPSAGLVAIANLTLSGAQTIDGVAGTAGTTIVLASAQTTASQNGPWVMQTGSWTRPTWFPSGGATQAFQFIEENVRLGTVYAGSVWKMTSSGVITIDTTSQTWAQQAQQAATATNLGGGAVGSMPYQTASGATAMLPGNTAASDQVPVSHGTGSAAQAPTLSNAPALSAANMTSFPATAMPWIPFVRNGSGTITFSSTSNKALVWGIPLSIPLSVTKINYKVSTADTGSNSYDIGLATSAGAVAGSGNCHTGSLAASNFTIGLHQVSLVGTCTIPPGLYYIAITTNGTTGIAVLTATNGDTVTVNPASAGDSVGISAGGTLSSFTAPSTATWTFTATAPVVGFQ